MLHRYLRRMISKLVWSDGITRDTETRLDSWFVEPLASWVEPRDHRMAESEERPDEKNLEGHHVTGWERLKKQTRMVVLGQPGAGKTSLLRKLAIEHANMSLSSDEPSLPVYVQLRDVRTDRLELLNASSLVPFEDDDLLRLMRVNDAWANMILVLDGLDECPSRADRQRILEFVRSLCDVAPTVRVIISTREPAYDWTMEDFTHVRLEPFDRPRVLQWSLQYFARNGHEASWRSFIHHLSDVPDVYELATNPLLLTLITSLYARDRVVPENKALVFERCFEALLQDWDAARGVQRWPDSRAMHRQMRLALGDLSFVATSDNRDAFFSAADLARRSEKFVGLRSSPDAILAACAEAVDASRR